MPCLNLGMECMYQDQLVELERIVLELKALGPVIMMGDFNAHLCPPMDVSSCNTGLHMFRGFF